MGILRVNAQGLAKGINGVVVTPESAISKPEAVPSIVLLWIDSDGQAISFDGFVELVEGEVKVPEIVQSGGMHWIAYDGLAKGINGVNVMIKSIVSKPEVVPGGGIILFNADGLAISFDGFVVTIKSIISNPEVDPSIGILRLVSRPFSAPIKHPLPVFHVLQGNGTFYPFSLTESLGGKFTTLLDLAYPLHWYGKVQALPAFDVKGG